MKEKLIHSSMVILGVIIALCFALFDAQAQGAPLDCAYMTGGNATLIVPESVERPSYASYLWAEDQTGECVGIAEVVDSSFAMAVWGSDQYSDEVGIGSGEEFRLLVQKTNFVYNPDLAFSDQESFYSTESVYERDAIYLLNSLPEPVLFDSTLRAALDSLTMLATSATEELANIEAIHQAEMQAQAESYESTINQQSNQIDNLQNQIAGLQDQVGTLEMRLSDALIERDYALSVVRETNRILRQRNR